MRGLMVRGRLRNFVNVVLKPVATGPVAFGSRNTGSTGESSMSVRVAVACACIMAAMGASPAFAQELAPEQARAFIAGKLFVYNCFDGTTGMGRIFADGSIIGTIRPPGSNQVRFATLPAGTIKVTANSVCAHLPGLPIDPCFKVQRIDYHSFRGSISGLGFAYCDFFQHNPRAALTRRAPAAPPTALATVRPAP
jgi:hypothetical protein